MVIYKAEGVSLNYQADRKLFIQKWKGFSSSEIFRTALDITLDFVKENPVDAILNNTLEQTQVKHEDVEYAAKILPQLFANGVKAMAIIIPDNVYTQMSLKKFEEDTKGTNINLFTQESHAMDWIKG